MDPVNPLTSNSQVLQGVNDSSVQKKGKIQNLTTLPRDTLSKIVEFLPDGKTVVDLSRVNKLFYETLVSTDVNAWGSVFKFSFKKDYGAISDLILRKSYALRFRPDFWKQQTVLKGLCGRMDQLESLLNGRIVLSSYNRKKLFILNPDQPENDPIEVLWRDASSSRFVVRLTTTSFGKIAYFCLDSTSGDRALGVWDPVNPTIGPTQHIINDTTGTTSLLTLPNGRIAVIGTRATDDRGFIRVWNSETPSEDLIELQGSPSRYDKVLILPGGEIISISTDGIVQIWDPNRPVDAPKSFKAPIRSMTACLVFPDGRIALGSSDSTVHILKPHTPEDNTQVLKKPITGHLVRTTVCFRNPLLSGPEFIECPPDPYGLPVRGENRCHVTGLTLLAGVRIAAAFDDGTIAVWKLQNLQEPPLFVKDGSGGCITCIALPDGRIAFTNNGWNLKVWNPGKKPEHVLSGNTHRFFALQDGRIFYVADTGKIMILGKTNQSLIEYNKPSKTTDI